jgi:STE24 endopeptidase
MWFAWAGAGAAALTVVGSFLYPVLLEPVFNEFEPLPDGSLRNSVFELADKEGVAIDDVLVADASRRTTTLNAYVSGFGSTRRVVVYDNLVNDLPPSEARVVVAHELAHAKHSDVVLGTSLGALGAVLGVSLLALALDSRRARKRADVAGAGDPAAVPLVLALAAVAMLVASPVQNAISRAIEVRADRDSLIATGESDTFVSMQRELALASLNDPTPPFWSHFWFGSHPTVLQRAGLPSSMAAAEDAE